MTYASQAAAHQETPIDIIEVVIGTTTKRWATADITISGAGFYEGRIVSMTDIDRELADGGPILSDCSVTLDNKDGGIDTLLTSFTDANLNFLRCTATFKRGFASLGYANFQDVATMQFSQLEGGDGQTGQVTIYFTDPADRLFGPIQPPTVSAVISALQTHDGTNWNNVTVYQDRKDEPVSIVYGQHQKHNIHAYPAGYYNSDETTHIDKTVFLVAVGPSAFDDTTFQRTVAYYSIDGEDTVYNGAPSNFDSIDMTATAGYHVLVARDVIPSGTASAHFGDATDTWWSVSSLIGGTARPPTVTDAIEQVLHIFAERSSRWTTTYVDTASFTTAEADMGVTSCLIVIDKEVNSIEWLRGFGEAFDLDLYINASGKLAATTLVPWGFGAAAAPDLSITEEEHVLGISYRYSGDGERHGLINSFTIESKKPPWLENEKHQPWDPFRITLEDSTSITNHDRTVEKTVSSDLYATEFYGWASYLYERMKAKHTNPRMILEVTLPLVAATIELGDTVGVTHSRIPGFSGEVVCVCDAIKHDFVGHTVTLRLVNFDSYLGSKIGVYDDEDNWVVMEGAAGETISMTASSASVTYSFTALDENDITAGDILVIGGWPGGPYDATKNNLHCYIKAIDTGTNTITLSSLGGETGALPTVNESGSTRWRIYRGQENRSTSAGDYIARDDKYLTLCSSDGLFIDDTTAGYEWGI
ncbi:MAG: hypothetical protein ACE5EX_01830 [Phycisphaerae bacterium]